MVLISIPSNGPAKINFFTFMNYLLPVPPNGIVSDREKAVLLFDSEDEAKTYADELTKLPGSQRKIGNEIVRAIMKIFRGKKGA